MNKDTIITSAVTIFLNLTWSIVFDLLPNIVDFSIIGEIQVSKYLLFIPVLAVMNIGVIFFFRAILRKSWERETFMSQFNSAINKLIEQDTPDIIDRPPHMVPGTPQSLLQYYYEVLIQLKNFNGKITFELQDPPPNSFDFKMPIYLSNITPGMSKYFMVITQDFVSENPDYVRIIPDYKGNAEEFTYTWFDNIFPILGNFSDYISVKEMPLPNMWESSGCYVIRKYKIYIKKGRYFIKISVI